MLITALLVGIDEYPDPVSSLSGCVNDITAIEQYLDQWLAQDYQLHPVTLKNQKATRQAIIS